jgi:hypothetical protein
MIGGPRRKVHTIRKVSRAREECERRETLRDRGDSRQGFHRRSITPCPVDVAFSSRLSPLCVLMLFGDAHFGCHRFCFIGGFSGFRNKSMFRKRYLCSGIDPRSDWILVHCQDVPDFGTVPDSGHLPEASSFGVGIFKRVWLW